MDIGEKLRLVLSRFKRMPKVPTAFLRRRNGAISTVAMEPGWPEPDGMKIDGVQYKRVGELEYEEMQNEYSSTGRRS